MLTTFATSAPTSAQEQMNWCSYEVLQKYISRCLSTKCTLSVNHVSREKNHYISAAFIQSYGKMQGSIWDGDTMIASQSLNASSYKASVLQKKANTKNKTPKPATIPCTVSGCEKLFISNAERDNHIDFNHGVEADTVVSEFAAQVPVEVEASLGVSEDEGDATILARAAKQEETIKPKLTAASLQALEDSSAADPMTSVTKSLQNVSINDDDDFVPDASVCDEYLYDEISQDPRQSTESVMSLDETTFSVEDPLDDDRIGEIWPQDSPEIILATKIVLYLWAKSVNDASRRSQQGFRQHAPRAGSQGQRSSFSISRESLASAETSSEVSGTPSLRRKRDSDEGDGNVSRKNPKRNNSSQTQERPFACPYNKQNSYRFGNDPNSSQYHVCNTWNDSKTAYLKQHLVRTHCYSEFSCDRCFHDFKNHVELRAHRRMEPPCAVGVADDSKIMPEHQAELGLRTRNVVGLDRTQYWYRVYDTIFGPGARRQRPVEPYYTGPYSEILQQFVHFASVRIPDIVRLARQQMHVISNTSVEYDAELGRTVLQEAMQFFMSELTSSRQPSIQQIRDENTPVLDTVNTDNQTIAPRDVNRALPELRPANWQAAIPTHVPQQAMQNMQVPLQNFRQVHRPIVSAPTTPSPAAVFPEPMNMHQQPDYAANIWPSPDPNQFEEMMGGFDPFSPNDLNYTADSLSQVELEEYVIDDFPGNHRLGHSGRQERRLPG